MRKARLCIAQRLVFALASTIPARCRTGILYPIHYLMHTTAVNPTAGRRRSVHCLEPGENVREHIVPYLFQSCIKFGLACTNFDQGDASLRVDATNLWIHTFNKRIHPSMDKIVYTSCTLDCPDGCGIRAHVHDGRVVKLQGDPGHPFTRGYLCAK